MKQTSLLLALLAATLAPAAVQAADPDYKVAVDFPFTSKYVFRGLQLAKASLQPSVEISNADGYAGVVGTNPLLTGQKNEIDFYAARTLPLDGGWKFDLGGFAYYFPQGYSTPGLSNTSFEAYAGVTGGRIAGGLAPSLYTYYDFTRETYTVQGALGGSLPVKSLGLSLDGTLTLGHVGGKKGADYTYWGAGVKVPYALNSRATFTLGANYTSNDLSGAKHNLLYFGAGVTVSF